MGAFCLWRGGTDVSVKSVGQQTLHLPEGTRHPTPSLRCRDPEIYLFFLTLRWTYSSASFSFVTFRQPYLPQLVKIPFILVCEAYLNKYYILNTLFSIQFSTTSVN